MLLFFSSFLSVFSFFNCMRSFFNSSYSTWMHINTLTVYSRCTRVHTYTVPLTCGCDYVICRRIWRLGRISSVKRVKMKLWYVVPIRIYAQTCKLPRIFCSVLFARFVSANTYNSFQSHHITLHTYFRLFAHWARSTSTLRLAERPLDASSCASDRTWCRKRLKIFARCAPEKRAMDTPTAFSTA